MTQISWPWFTNPPSGDVGDGSEGLNEQRSREFLATYFGVQDPTVEGICKGVLGELEVSGATSPLTVAPGAAVCYGLFISDANVNLAVPTPTTGPTFGYVILRTNWKGNGDGDVGEASTRLAIKMAADGSGTPPALTQTPGTRWEIAIAGFVAQTNGTIGGINNFGVFRKWPGISGPLSVNSAALMVGAVNELALGTRVVTTDKAGAGVPGFAGRRGGNSVRWDVVGTSLWSPQVTRSYVMVSEFNFTNGSNEVNGLVPYPAGVFADKPVAFATFGFTNFSTNAGYPITVTAWPNADTNEIRVRLFRPGTAGSATVVVNIILFGTAASL